MMFLRGKVMYAVTHSRAPGTLSNRDTHVRNYLSYCFDLGIDPVLITEFEALAYIEYLAGLLSSPKSIQNYLGGVKNFLQRRHVTNSPFTESYWVKQELDFHARRKDHQVKKMLPLTPWQVRKLLTFSYQSGVDAQIRLAFSFMYYLSFRQSEVAPHSQEKFNHQKNITRQEVGNVDNFLWIHQKWSKTLQLFDQERDLYLPRAPDPMVCPLTFLDKALKELPTRFAHQPLVVFRDYSAMNCAFLTVCLRRGVATLGMDPSLYSLHSFRRSAPTNAFKAGVSADQIQRFGGWASKAHQGYIKTQAQVEVSEILMKQVAEAEPPK